MSPTLLKEQSTEWNRASLILDESKDIACIKHLYACCHYYNATENWLTVSKFNQVNITTAEDLKTNINNCFNNIRVNLNTLFVIRTYGVSNLGEINYSFNQFNEGRLQIYN